MSTQHPDNANVPEWNTGQIIDGTAEILEAHFAYENLGCQEVMWDAEGKDVDTRVVRKLLTQYKDFFTAHTIGEDVRLTYRIPNPSIEVVEKKVFVETLQNIPVAYDVASSFYQKETTPIFEVILPFTTDSKELIMLRNYYKKVIIADEEVMLDGAVSVKDWVGEFKPKNIQVIPLVEDFDSLFAVDQIVQPYIDAAKPRSLRVFLARSDPALNYGVLCAVLLTKIPLSKLKILEKTQNVAIHPIIGAGSKPFRGHLSPSNIERFFQEYRGVSTVTIQSAFRYDYPIEQVKECVKLLNEKLPNGEPVAIPQQEEAKLLSILQKSRQYYESSIENLAPLINSVASYVPPRRARKLHIGLFGYSRNVAGVSLPRAITFAAALYSIGVPPEFVGCNVLEELSDEELELMRKHYINMSNDFSSVGGYVAWQNINMLMENHEKAAERARMNADKLKIGLAKILGDLKAVEETLNIRLGPRSLTDKRHENFVNNFLIAYLEREDSEAKTALAEAAKLRRCLG